MSIDTHFYLIDLRRYEDELVPALDRLVAGVDESLDVEMFDEAVRRLANAESFRRFPWTPFHRISFSPPDRLVLLEGKIPSTYRGARGRSFDEWLSEDYEITDPERVREHHIKDHAGFLVEGLCVPWELSFPPMHPVSKWLGHSLYKHSRRFEEILCGGEFYDRSRPAPYDMCSLEDAIVGLDLVNEMATEICRVVPRGGELWEQEEFRNLHLLLRHAVDAPRMGLLVTYF